MKNRIDASNIKKRQIYELSEKFHGNSIDGHTLKFTNYYMTIDGKPFLGVSGECHFSRVAENQWEDTILLMKAGGISIVATYVFWIHHEEQEGIYRFDGRRNLRKFVELCAKHGLYVILRVGPFDHGEVRNGGLPDWLLGKPFDSRCSSEGFLHYTRLLYREIAKQVNGLFYKDGGPIIAAQMDNEYMHSAAPWEVMAGSTDEWIGVGKEGNTYLLNLKKIAQEEGIITPFYTCTGWGGAATPTDELLPLWGGYAYWPWIFLNYDGPHPVTPEYIFRDYHNNDVLNTYNFEPFYEPESMPYACCEMGGGMSVFYRYRFQLDYRSVDAMANIKLGSGCNFLGYYMYRGGSNPKGVNNEFLNEGQCAKITYDYQAPIGEYGQIRPSFHRLRALHLFMKNYGQELSDKMTILPENVNQIKPEDLKTLRYAIRTNGYSGFLFINNFQDHIEMEKKEHQDIDIILEQGEKIVFSDLALEEGESVILPFNLKLKDNVVLVSATAQPLSVQEKEDEMIYFFYTPSGMQTIYRFDPTTIEETKCVYEMPQNMMGDYVIHANTTGKAIRIVTLTREQSLQFYELDWKEQKYAVLSSLPILSKEESLELLIEGNKEGRVEAFFMSYPSLPLELTENYEKVTVQQDIFQGYSFTIQTTPVKELETEVCGKFRYKVTVPAVPENWKDGILQIEYTGDVGQAFINGQMISDNYCNDTTWEIGMKEIETAEKLLQDTEIVIRIVPQKIGAGVDTSSFMAGRVEVVEKEIGDLFRVSWKEINTIKIG